MPERDPLERLREPFKKEKVSKLPKYVDDEKPKAKCRTCGGFHSPARLHLDYVGHADVTERLLDVDPLWKWTPPSREELDALVGPSRPALERNDKGQAVGLWIRLEVNGMSRLGYGSVAPGKSDAVKELIGDAIRNAAMRFGVALELWRKENAADVIDEQNSPSTRPKGRKGGYDSGSKPDAAAAKTSFPQTPPSPAAPASSALASQAQLGLLHKLAGELGYNDDERHQAAGVDTFKKLTASRAKELISRWQREVNQLAKARHAPDPGPGEGYG